MKSIAGRQFFCRPAFSFGKTVLQREKGGRQGTNVVNYIA